MIIFKKIQRILRPWGSPQQITQAGFEPIFMYRHADWCIFISHFGYVIEIGFGPIGKEISLLNFQHKAGVISYNGSKRVFNSDKGDDHMQDDMLLAIKAVVDPAFAPALAGIPWAKELMEKLLNGPGTT